VFLNPEQAEDKSNFHDRKTGTQMDVVERLAFLEWLATNYKNFGATLEFVSDKSQEGSQFVKGFGGIGGFLRYEVDFIALEEYDDLDNSDDDFI